MDVTPPPLPLPVVTIENTFTEVIQEVRDGIIPFDKFWVSCYKSGEPSVHAKVIAELDDVDRDLVLLKAVENDVDVEKESGSNNYSVACKLLGIPPTKVVLPVQQYRDEERADPTRPHRITAFDVAPDSSRFATGFMDGSVFLYPTLSMDQYWASRSLQPEAINTTRSKLTSKPHLSSVTSLQFFPSSRVILSAGQDFSLSILPAELPEPSPASRTTHTPTRLTPALHLRSHTKSITSTAIIDVGRNILSSSLDGTVKLWDIPSSGGIIRTLRTGAGFGVGVTSMCLGVREAEVSPYRPPDGDESVKSAEDVDQREVLQTAGKLVYCGLSNGSFQVFDLRAGKSLYLSPANSSGSSITSIAHYEHSHLLATGSSSGVVNLYDTRSLGPGSPSISPSSSNPGSLVLGGFTRQSQDGVAGNGGIESMTFVSLPPSGLVSATLSPSESHTEAEFGLGLAIGTSDGLPYIASVVPDGPCVWAEMVGGDCDGVRGVVMRDLKIEESSSKQIWSASDDGLVRRYTL